MGSLSTGTTFIFWIFYTVIILIAYHKLFDVVYFNMAKGLLKEFIIAAIVGIILTGISLSKPIIGISVIAILALITMGKIQNGVGKVVILILAIIASIIVGIVGHNVQKNMDDDNNAHENAVAEEIDEKDVESDSRPEISEEDYFIQDTPNAEISKKEFELDKYKIYRLETAEEMAHVLIDNGEELVFMEEFNGYGFIDASLILQDTDYGPCIMAQYCGTTTVFMLDINTDMSLEEADYILTNNGAEDVSLPDDNAWRYNIENVLSVNLFSAGEQGINIVVKPWNSEVIEQAGGVFAVDQLLAEVIEGNYDLSAGGLKPFFENAGYEVDWFSQDDTYWYSISEGAVWWCDGDNGIEIYLEDLGNQKFSLYGLTPQMTYEEACNHIIDFGAEDLGEVEGLAAHEFLLDDKYNIFILPNEDYTVIAATGYKYYY